MPRAITLPDTSLTEIGLGRRAFADIRGDLAPGAWPHLASACEEARALLAGRPVWSINSTVFGGGVSEMQRTLWPYWRGAGIDARWLVLTGSPAYFRFTKRLHNLLHGVAVRRPDRADRALFERIAGVAASEAVTHIAPGDIVLLQDPQTAGLVAPLRRAGATVVWRSHVGADSVSEPVHAAWRFLLPYIEAADAFVFTRGGFVPGGLPADRVALLTPAIDPQSEKNRPLPPGTARSILDRGHLAPVSAADRLVVALARWDRLKDPVGILHAFARHVEDPRAFLVLAGPEVCAVTDDPEGARVLAETQAAWRDLAPSRRSRVQVAALPLADLDENARLVNALQREAAVVVKKSLQEGFGLGVTEGMWKAKPVVATRVGGHRDQIEHARSGLLVDDPANLPAFGAAIDRALADPGAALGLGAAGRERVRGRYLADRHFVSWMAVFRRLVAAA